MELPRRVLYGFFTLVIPIRDSFRNQQGYYSTCNLTAMQPGYRANDTSRPPDKKLSTKLRFHAWDPAVFRKMGVALNDAAMYLGVVKLNHDLGRSSYFTEHIVPAASRLWCLVFG